MPICRCEKLLKKSIDIYFKYVSIKEDKEKKINLTINPENGGEVSREAVHKIQVPKMVVRFIILK